ncbi:MAG: pyridoxal phosphate-dependent aminotransferase [Candidatus Latescibacteria bacterium]|nr:pyridoxal phosphate-dependent aminotransferase [Candidatus Latescibacterota bacterium]
MAISRKVATVQPSITLAISARAKALKAHGVDVIALSAGEPDFGTPRHICDAGIEAINSGFTTYTPASGAAELKEAVRGKFKHDNGLDYSASQVMINCGAKHSVFLAVFALAGEGDEVLVPSPYWVSYPEIVRLAGGTPVVIECVEEHSLKLTPGGLERAITPKTKILILNSPSNPTGMVYSEAELRELAEVLSGTGVYVISDEIYEMLVYDGVKHVSFASLSPDAYGRTITVNGVSKAFSMTGWRIGYAAGPEEVIRGMSTVQSQETSNPCSISQKAALAALKGGYDFLEPMLVELDRRRTYVADRLNGIRSVSCAMPKGAFYVFPNVSGLYGGRFGGKEIDGSVAFCEYMLNERHIAIVPGAGFGADGNVRISYASSMENLEKALDRFEAGIRDLD